MAELLGLAPGGRLAHLLSTLAIFSAKCLDRRIPDSAVLASEVGAREQTRNETATIVNRRLTTTDARIKLKYLYPSQQG